MVSPSIGVRPRIRYAVNRIDEDYFDGEDLWVSNSEFGR